MEFRVAPIRYNTLFVRFYMLVACLAFGLGGAFAIGGERRFSGPSFRATVNLVQWVPVPAHVIWGSIFLAYGIVLVMVLGRVGAIHALRLGVVIYLFLVSSFIGSLFIDPQAAISGIVAYTAFAIAHLFLSDHLTHRGWEGC